MQNAEKKLRNFLTNNPETKPDEITNELILSYIVADYVITEETKKAESRAKHKKKPTNKKETSHNLKLTAPSPQFSLLLTDMISNNSWQ